MIRTTLLIASFLLGGFLILSYVHWFGVNVPINDDWDHVETTLRWLENGVDLKTVFAPYNEHCIAVTRLLAHAVLTTTGDYRVFLATNAAFTVAALAVLLAFVRRWPLPSWCVAAFATALALLLTAWCQWQILLWACTTPWFFLPLVLVAAAATVARATSPWVAVASAAAASLVAVVTNSNGLFVGWALVPGMALRLWDEPRATARQAAIAFAACLLLSTAIGGLLIAPGRGAAGGGLASALASPVEAIRCGLVVLGSPLEPVGAFQNRRAWSAVAGMLSLAVGGAAILAATRSRSALLPREFGPGYALMVYGLASVAVVVLGRLEMISKNPVESRYQTFAIAWHVGVLFSWACLAAGAEAGRWRIVARTVLVAASIACIATTVAAMPMFFVHGANMRRAISEHQDIYREARLPGGRERLEKISRHYGAERLLRNLDAMERAGILHPDLHPVAAPDAERP